MLSKRFESIEVNRRTWLHVPSGTLWSTSSDTLRVVNIQKETSFTILKRIYLTILILSEVRLVAFFILKNNDGIASIVVIEYYVIDQIYKNHINTRFTLSTRT